LFVCDQRLDQEPALDAETREILDDVADMDPADRRAIAQLARSLARRAPGRGESPATLHAPVTFAAIGPSIVLAACTDPVADAQERLRIISSTQASKADICDAHRRIVEAYLTAKRSDGYEEAKVTADIYCQSAELDPGGQVDANGHDIIIVADSIDNSASMLDQIDTTPKTTATEAAKGSDDNAEIGRDNWAGE
jgi:hypothetical protein